MAFSKEKEQKVINNLQTKTRGMLACSRCGRSNFEIIGDYFTFTIQEDLRNHSIGGPSIPAYGTVCTNCGHLDFHAANAITPEEL